MRRRRATEVKTTATNAAAEPEATEVIGYIRVSTADQADSGLGLAAQRARVEAYATAQGWKLIKTYVDAGVSAKTLDRPELTKAIAELRKGRILLALKLDRLTRTARDLGDLTEIIQEKGADWATVEGNYDTSNAMGRFMLRLVAELAQLEREVTAERTVAALDQKAKRRERLGTTPLGYQTIQGADGERHVTIDADEQETVRIARAMRARGLSFRHIAKSLADAGRKTKRGGSWRPGTVALLIEPRYLEEIASEPKQ